MKLIIEGTEQEIKNTIQAISGSKDRVELNPKYPKHEVDCFGNRS